MVKDAVPSDLMPSSLLCYDRATIDKTVCDLIQRAYDARVSRDWPAMAGIAGGVAHLPPTVRPCERAISLVYLADLAWDASRFPSARGAYEEATTVFHLLTTWEDRHNEAAATYGQGLAYHAAMNYEEAQRCYSQALSLFLRVKHAWATERNVRRFEQCTAVSSQIELLRKLCMDSTIPAPSVPAGATATVAPTPSIPTIVRTDPDRGALDVPIDRAIQITFSEAMDPNSLQDADYDLIPAVVRRGVQWDRSNQTATIRHDGFRHGETYTVAINRARALATGTPISPTVWTFTTQARSTAVIQFTWPCDGDVNIPLRAPLVVQCSQPIHDIAVTATPSLPPEQAPRRQWLDQRTIEIQFGRELQPNSKYQVMVHDVQDDKGNRLPVDPLASAPNPWSFQTVTSQLTRSATLSVVDLFMAAAMLLALIAASAAFLLIWQGWPSVVAYVLAWVVASLVLRYAVQKNHILFPLSADEEAIIHRDGRLQVMAGPMSPAWRWPIVEKLCAIVPVQPLTLKVADLRVTNDDRQPMSLEVEVRYRVFGSLKAFYSFRESCKDDHANQKVYREKELQAAWETQLRQVIVPEVHRKLKGARQQDLEKHQRRIEIELMQSINLKAFRCGIEIQDLQFIQI